MTIGSPVPSRPSDSGDYVLRSGARSGYKREFAFALRAQAEAGLPRTRSGQSPSSHHRISSKRARRDDEIAEASPDPEVPSSPKEPVTPETPGRRFTRSVLKASPIQCLAGEGIHEIGQKGSMTETAIVVGDHDEANVVESVAETPVVVEIRGCNSDTSVVQAPLSDSGLGKSKKSSATLDKSKKRVTRSALKSVGTDTVTAIMAGDEVKNNVDDLVVETAVLCDVDAGSVVVESESVVQAAILIAGPGQSKKYSATLDISKKRVTRSALKSVILHDSADKADLSVCVVEGHGADSNVQVQPNEMIDLDSGTLDKADLSVHDVKGPRVDSNVVEQPNEVANLESGMIEKPDQVIIMGDGASEKPAKRFTRSVLKGLVIEQELSMVDSPVKVHEECKVDNSVTEKPARKYIRLIIKPPMDPSAKETSETSDASEETKSGDIESMRISLKKKMELKMSKKIALTKLPSNVRDLLATGLLEGYPVKYNMCNGKPAGPEGVIRGNMIVCYCASCKGSKAFSAFNFEVHAGSTKKHPSDFIFLDNGKSLRDVLKACTSAPLDMLEAAIQNAIGVVPAKRLSVCQKCGVSFRTSHTGEFALLCDSCLRGKQPQTVAVPSNGSSGNAKLSRTASVPDSSYSISKTISSNKKNSLSRTTLVPESSDSASKSISANKKSSVGKLTKKDVGLHKLVFMGDILPEGTEVAYYHRAKRVLDGYIKGSGIFCHHCNAVVSPSQFEVHAGRASRKKPYNNIYTSNGVSLHELSVSLSKDRKLSTSENDDLCNICYDGGDLLLCDLCPRAFHRECLGLPILPNGDFHCQRCQSMHHREKCVSYNNNAIAAGRVAGVDPIEQIIKRCIRIVTTPGTDVGGCILCRLYDFSVATFDDRTVLICDQCEKEYHVGCLRDHNMCDLKELPEEEWFCCSDCSRIHAALQELLICESEPLLDLDADIIWKKRDEKGLGKDDVDVKWRLVSGKNASVDSRLVLTEVIYLFRESFNPIAEGATGCDLIPYIFIGKNMRDQGFGGMYCVVLTMNTSVVSAGILCVLGGELAELPIIVTSRNSQGQGYFQSLFSRIERVLGSLNVKHFVLLAAAEALSIWTKKFGFAQIAPDQLMEYSKGAHTMFFHGTSMLHKPVPLVLRLPHERNG